MTAGTSGSVEGTSTVSHPPVMFNVSLMLPTWHSLTIFAVSSSSAE